jgi:hypothetical protein
MTAKRTSSGASSGTGCAVIFGLIADLPLLKLGHPGRGAHRLRVVAARLAGAGNRVEQPRVLAVDRSRGRQLR